MADDDLPIVAQSADGVLHEFPAGTAESVIDGVMRNYARSQSPDEESRGTWKSDIQTGFHGTSQAMAGNVAVRASQEIESLKKQIETFKQGEPDLPPQLRHLAPQRQRQVPLLEKKLAEAEKRYAQSVGEVAQDAQVLEALPVNEPAQRFTSGELGEALKNPGAVARGLIGQSAPAMIPLIVGAALGGVPGGAIAGGAIGAATGGGQEAVRILAERKIDAKDPEAVKRALADPEIRAEIDRAFGIGQAIDTTVGAATGGLGGVTVPAKTALGAVAKNVGLQAAGQGSLSAGGEAAKQGIIEGELQPGKIAAAGLGEALFAPADAAAAAFHARTRPSERIAAREVMAAENVDDAVAIAIAQQATEAEASPVEATPAEGEPLGFGSANPGDIVKAPDGTFEYSVDEKSVPLKSWEPTADAPEKAGASPTLTPEVVAAQRAYFEPLGIEVRYFENDNRIPFDGAVSPSEPDTIFLSNNPQRNAMQVLFHEGTHLLESTTLPDGTRLVDLLHSQVKDGLTVEGWDHAMQTFGATAPERGRFRSENEHAEAVVNHMVREMAAEAGGQAPRMASFLPKVVDAVEQRWGPQVAKDVLVKLVNGIRQAMETVRGFFQGEPQLQRWLSNSETVLDTLAQMHAAKYGERLDTSQPRPVDPGAGQRLEVALQTPEAREAQARIDSILGKVNGVEGRLTGAQAERLKLARDRLNAIVAEATSIGTGPSPSMLRAGQPQTAGVARRATPPIARGRAVMPAQPAAPAVEIRQELPQSAKPEPAPISTQPAPVAETAQPAPAPKVPQGTLPDSAVTEPVAPPPQSAAQAEPVPATVAETPQPTFDDLVKAKKEEVWADKTVMGKVRRGIPRNENFANDVARERVMREEVGQDAIADVIDRGIPADAVSEIARMYRRDQGQAPTAAFDAAVDRWITKEEARAALQFGDEDVATFDMLKVEAERADPWLAEHFARLEEMYAGGRKDPNADNLPFGSEPTTPPAGDRGETARVPPAGRGGVEAGGEPGGRGEVLTEPARPEPKPDVAQQVVEARAETNTDPTEGQKEAGNYAKGRVDFHGLPFVMENPEGSIRRGVDSDGKAWEAKLPADYGYFSRTKGADGDQIDAYIGKHHDSQRVWVIDQIDPKTGSFDEHKIMLGMRSVTEARTIYHRAFSDGSGPKRIGAITEMSLDRFKAWLEDGDTKSPVGKIEQTQVQKERVKLAEQRERAKGPTAFSPRRTDTEPPGPTLIETPEATPEELASRQRARDREEAEAQMRGRDTTGKPQDAADDLPLFGGDRQKTLFSPKVEKPFYSALTRAVEGARLDKAPPGQWLNTVKNMPGVKAEERAWTGLDDWLAGQPRPVTKAEVLDYLRAHEIRVEEVQKGGAVPEEAVEAIRDWVSKNPDVVDLEWGPKEWAELARGDSRIIGELEGWGVPGNLLRPVYDNIGQGATKFGTYVLPGGENYRELLLTLPERPTDNAGVGLGLPPGAMDRVNFHGSHWDEPNVLAHIRFDDRVGPNGEKVLHVAEVQSDWHQAGRKKGYRDEAAHKAFDDYSQELAAKYNLNPLQNLAMYATLKKMDPAEVARYEELQSAAYRGQGDRQVPDAPFKTTWPELAMKRVIRYAAEHGYDRVSWDTGATNAERYDLSKTVSKIDYNPDSGKLLGYDKSGAHVLDTRASTDQLADYIGKDAADKLMAAEPNKGWHRLEGDDLKIDAPGMLAFYDKQLPILANKLGKRFGAKVEESRVVTKGAKSFDEFAEEYKANWGDLPREDMLKMYEQYGREQGRPAHSIAITPAMRASVMQGQALFSPKITGENPNRPYSKELRESIERTSGKETRTWNEVLAEVKQDLGKKLVAGIADRFVGVMGRDPSGYAALRIANDSTAAFDIFSMWGPIEQKGRGYVTKGDETGGPVKLIKDLGNEAHDWIRWVAVMRAERLKAEDREHLYTAEDIAIQKKELIRGKLDEPYRLSNGKMTTSREAAYLDALARYDAINKNAQDLAVTGGLVKRGVVDALWSNPFYVPMYRQVEADRSRSFVGPTSVSSMVGQTAGKRLTGGTEKLNANLWENAFGNWAHLIDASIRNRASNQVLETGVKDGIVDRVSQQDYDQMSKTDKENVRWTMVDGEKAYWHIKDPFLLRAVSGLDYVPNNHIAMRTARMAKRLLQIGVAADPNFQIVNLIKDTTNAIAASPISLNVFKNFHQGIKSQDVLNGVVNAVWRAPRGEELQRGKISRETADAIAGGGTMRYAAGADTDFASASTYLDTPGKWEAFKKYAADNFRAGTGLLGFSENVNRLALIKQMREKGAPADLAALQGRDLGDYYLSGDSPIIQFFVQTVPYMNPWLQGLYKVGRVAAAKDQNVALAIGKKAAMQLTVRAAAVYATMTAFNMVLDAFYADDDDYKARNEYDRNSNFWFKFGDREWRVPMGFEVAALSRLSANWLESLYDTDMTVGRAWKNTLSIIGTNMAFNPTPQLIKPALDVAMNESRTGVPIESPSQRRLQPESRYTADNSLIMRGVSEALNAAFRTVGTPSSKALSPEQLDYLVQGYTGWLGTTALQMADTVVRGFSSEPERPARDFLGVITKGRISSESTRERGSGRYLNMLYEQGGAIEEAYNSYRDLLKRGRVAEAREFFESNREAIQKHGIVSATMRLAGDLNQRIRMIENSDDPRLTPERKRLMIMEINVRKNRAAEQAMRPRD